MHVSAVQNSDTVPYNKLILWNKDIAAKKDKVKNKIKSSLYSRCYAEACNEWRDHLRGLTPGQHKNVAAMASRWRQAPI